jgi:hypothetical protein
MAIPDKIRMAVECSLISYIEQKIPLASRDKVSLSYQFRGDTVTLFKNQPYSLRPSELTSSPVAQFWFDPEKGNWSLYWRYRSSRWRRYSNMEPTEDFDQLLHEINEDSTGIFWG